jgi:tetratricopeptide (TPR) repeat protein/predicted aspartyl protease
MGGRKALFASLVLALSAVGSTARAADRCDIGKFAELPTTMAGMVPRVSVKVEGVDTTFMVDSGAFFSFMNPEAAHRLKLSTYPAPIGYYVHGVGGTDNRVDVATVHTFGLGANNIPNVRFLVLPGIGSGTSGILGQNVLSVFDTEYDLGNGVIRLMHPSEGCRHAMLAYWAGDKAVGVVDIDAIRREDPHLRGEAKINGQTIKVTLDTGASTSVLRLSAARRLGFRPDSADVRAAGIGGGIGSRVLESWVAPFESFEIGGEKITNTRLRVADIDLQNSDMLLGADFFLSHRVYVSHQTHRVFFTYNGGPVFRLDRAVTQPVQAAAPQAPGAPIPTASASGAAVDEKYANTPTDAAGFARRGEASMSRRDYAAALADFTKAIQLEPAEPQHYRDRARAHLGAGHPVLARADFDQALKLKPDDTVSLIGRGELHLAAKDMAGAKADFAAAVRAEPNRQLQVALLYTGAGAYPEAVAAYDGWIAANPRADNLSVALNGRCWARTVWNHDLDAALADCDAALRRGPRIAMVFDSRGLTHLRRGEFDAAIADYDTALKMQPKLAWALYGRGLAERGKGQGAAAEADLSAAAALQPDLPALAKRYGLAERPLAAAPSAPVSR